MVKHTLFWVQCRQNPHMGQLSMRASFIVVIIITMAYYNWRVCLCLFTVANRTLYYCYGMVVIVILNMVTSTSIVLSSEFIHIYYTRMYICICIWTFHFPLIDYW